jgi:hypothetical protein
LPYIIIVGLQTGDTHNRNTCSFGSKEKRRKKEDGSGRAGQGDKMEDEVRIGGEGSYPVHSGRARTGEQLQLQQDTLIHREADLT